MAPPHLMWRGHGEFDCRVCKISFTSVEAKLAHMRQKQRAAVPGHVHCNECAENYYTNEALMGHLREAHPKSQELQCPACDAGPFPRLFMLVAHLEKGGCSKMNAELLDQLREQKMEFTKGLKQMTNEPIKHDFSGYLPSHAEIRAKKALYEEHNRKFAGASPPSCDAPPPFNTSSHAWPRVSAQKTSTPSHHEVSNIMDADIKQLEALSMSPETKPTTSSTDDIPNIMDAEDDLKSVNTPILQPGQPSLPPHLAAQQLSAGLRQSPWGKGPEHQKPSAPKPAPKPSPWGSPSTLQHRPENRAGSPWGQTPSRNQQISKASASSSPQQRPNDVKPSDAQNATWGQKLFPNAPPARRPTEKQLATAYSLSEKQKYMLMDLDSPQHPDFNPAKYYSQYSDKFVCPKLGCGKCVKTANGLRAHLMSEAHSDQLYTCPRCLGRFRSLTAFVSHLESDSTRCYVRDARDFDALIDQVTSGLVDVAARRQDDGTNKYEISKTAQTRVKDLASGDPSYEEKVRSKVSATSGGWDDIKPSKTEGW